MSGNLTTIKIHLIFDSNEGTAGFKRVEYNYNNCNQKAEEDNLLYDEGRDRLSRYIGADKRSVKRVLYRI